MRSRLPSLDTDTATIEEVWFDASQHRDELLEYTQVGKPERNFHSAGLSSASGVAVATFKDVGYASKARYIKLDKGHDITSRAGFFAISMVWLAIMPDGFVLAGQPCRHYMFLSSSYHKRSPASNFIRDTSQANFG